MEYIRRIKNQQSYVLASHYLLSKNMNIGEDYHDEELQRALEASMLQTNDDDDLELALQMSMLNQDEHLHDFVYENPHNIDENYDFYTDDISRGASFDHLHFDSSTHHLQQVPNEPHKDPVIAETQKRFDEIQDMDKEREKIRLIVEEHEQRKEKHNKEVFEKEVQLKDQRLKHLKQLFKDEISPSQGTLSMLQIVLPNGERIANKFVNSDPLQRIFDYANLISLEKHNTLLPEDLNLVVSGSPQLNLKDKEMTIGEANLNRCVILLEEV